MARRFALEGRTVVITGAAGGLGRDLAAALHARGARLALLDLDAAAVGALAAGLPGSLGLVADVTDLASLERAFATAAEQFGGVDVAVANAGIETVAPVATHDPALWERVIDVNLTGVFRTYRAALPYVTARKGYLLGVSSMAAYVHSPLQSPYSASKAGVLALTNALRQELRGTGTRAGTLHPLFFTSPMTKMTNEDAAAQKVWGGNRGPFFHFVDRDDVVSAAVRMIEHRRRRTLVPREFAGMALVPGVVLPVVETLGFRTRNIRRAIELADPQKVSG